MNNIDVTIKLGVADVIFGFSNSYDDALIDLFNYCIMSAKYFIVQSRKNNTELSLYNLLRFLKVRIELEKVNCITEGKDEIFEKRFKVLYDSI